MNENDVVGQCPNCGESLTIDHECPNQSPQEEVILEPDPNYVPPLYTNEDISNIRAIKVSTGEDIITILVAIDTTAIILKYPFKVLRIAQENGDVNVLLVKWQPFSDAEFHILSKTHIVATSVASKQMVEFYLKTVDSLKNKDDEKKFVWPDWMDKPTKKQMQ